MTQAVTCCFSQFCLGCIIMPFFYFFLLQPSLPEFHAAFSVVFVDPSGHLNLLADMTAFTYKQVSTSLVLLQLCDNVIFTHLYVNSTCYFSRIKIKTVQKTNTVRPPGQYIKPGTHQADGRPLGSFCSLAD